MKLRASTSSGRRIGVLLAVAATAAGVLAGCAGQGGQAESIGYAIDGTVPTYNPNNAAGATSAARQAFVRVLTGFSYPGPSGTALPDTDFGTATPQPGPQQTIVYRINPAAVYSDGRPVTCDDLVLTWAARSGHMTGPGPDGGTVPLFDAASHAGYADIASVACAPGGKEATVTFAPGRNYQDWRSLFGATDIMPAHVVSRATGVKDIVGALYRHDQAAMEKIAHFWNTGWTLQPGKLDPALYPSSGPYKLTSYTEDGGIVLTANDRWWGDKPATPRIVLWPKGTDVQQKARDGAVQVVDLGAGSLGKLDLGSGFTVTTAPSMNTEQLILGTRGVFADEPARRAFALCVPRQQLMDHIVNPLYGEKRGADSLTLDSRLQLPGRSLYPAAAGVVSGQYSQPDAAKARQEVAKTSRPKLTVRIGYLAPDERRAQTVRDIADACAGAGVRVIDAGSPAFTPRALSQGGVDAVLAGTGGTSGTGGAESVDVRSYPLHTGAGDNFGGYSDPRVDKIIDQLAVSTSLDEQARLSVAAEQILWQSLPTIPLFTEPRTTAFANGLQAGRASPTWAGAGWNMDRWSQQT